MSFEIHIDISLDKYLTLLTKNIKLTTKCTFLFFPLQLLYICIQLYLNHKTLLLLLNVCCFKPIIPEL